jgi:hypothetical protein
MKRLLPGPLLALLASLGCANGVEIPAVEIGAGGARLMNEQARTPGEAYEKAYSYLGRAHQNVQRNLETRGQNLVGAREAMDLILRCLETMRNCVPEPERPKFEPYLAKYSGWLKALEDGTWGGAFLTDFERLEREVKTAFNPMSVKVLAEFPKAGPPPKRAELTPDKVEVPQAKETGTEEVQKPRPEPPPTPPVVQMRILFRAWSSAHDELVAAYKDKKACKAKFDDVVGSLRLLKGQFTGDKATRLQIYIDYYGDVDEKTKNFTALPDKTAEKDIVDELNIAARVIRKEFNPDK